MTRTQWNAFLQFRDDFRKKTQEWQLLLEKEELISDLKKMQAYLAKMDGVPPYPIDTPLLYNTALDEITEHDTIKLIVIGDNPGKDEQRKENKKYLVGQSGKIAANFFKRNSELGIDFRKNAIILNKTPLHTAKTKELQALIKTPSNRSKFSKNAPAINDNFRTKMKSFFEKSQIWMAEKTADLHKNLTKDKKDSCSLWLVGYAELKEKGLFIRYKEVLSKSYSTKQNSVFVFQHFSMNRFLIDLRKHSDQTQSLQKNLFDLGELHRKEILGW